MEVVILIDGTAVTLGTDFRNTALDTDGFLLEFNYKDNFDNRFRYYNHTMFKQDDRKRYTSLAGYYLEKEFLNYLQGTVSDSPTVQLLISKYKFNFDSFKSKEGDPVKLSIVDFGPPYSTYYQTADYTFNVEKAVDDKTVKNYKHSIYQGLKLIGYEISVPKNATRKLTEYVTSNPATRYFYQVNYTAYLDKWQDDTTKRNIKKLATLTAFRINDINNEIFPKLAQSSTWDNIDAVPNILAGNLDGLSQFQKLLFSLKQSWCYYYDPYAAPDYVYKKEPQSVFAHTPDYDDYLQYYNNLSSFYFTLYDIQDKLLDISEDLRLHYLLDILPISAFAVIPFEIIKDELSNLLQFKSLPQNTQRYLVHLVIALSNRAELADLFLDFLLERPDTKTTNFEILYRLLVDDRKERYTIVNWFVDEQPNRKYFAYAVHELWKVSKYNPMYAPDDDGVNAQSFFIKNPKRYNEKNIFEFSTYKWKAGDVIKDNSLYWGTLKNSTYTFTLVGDQFNTIRHNYSYVKDKYAGKSEEQTWNEDLKAFHIFHPLLLLDYKNNLDLTIPDRKPIPAFLFYYAEEYDKLVEYDARVSLAIDVSIDIALFFATGGISVINDLKYLKYSTQLGRALAGRFAASEALTVWRGAEIGLEGVALTNSTLANINNYLIATEDDEEKRKHLKRIQWIFMGLLFASAGAVVYSRFRAVREAEEVLEMIGKFPGKTHGVPDDVVDLLNKLAGKESVAIAKGANDLQNKLQALKTSGAQVDDVISRLNTLTNKDRYEFWQGFGKMNDPKEWAKLNLNNGVAVDRWLALKIKGIVEAVDMNYITHVDRYQALTRYYDEAEFREILETFSASKKLMFFDSFGQQSDEWFNFLKTNPSAISRWVTLNPIGKAIAKSNPSKWLYTFDRLYQNIPYAARLSDTEIIQRFGQGPLGFVNHVEAKALDHISTVDFSLLKKHELISGMYDKATNTISKTFHNFSGYDFNKGGAYDIFMNGAMNNPNRCFPNLRKRIEDVIAFKAKENYNMSDIEFFGNAGNMPGAHAEIRALDDSAKKRFPSYLTNPPTDEVFDAWLKNDVLGYNRNIRYGIDQQEVIMHTCVDCFHILDLVTFIKP